MMACITTATQLSCIYTRAGRSPTFWTRGLAILGLAGTRGLANPEEEPLSFKTSHNLSNLDH